MDRPDPRDALAAAMAAHQAGRLEEADRLYREAVRARPRDARALRLRGILARERGDVDASRGLLGRAAEVAPGDAAPLAELALTELAADDLDAAVRSLRAALLRDPGHARALANLGALLQYRGHVAEAIDCHGRVLAADPDDVEVRCNLAKALSEAGRGEEGVALCDAGLARSPAHPLLLAARGAVLCDLERFAEAADALEGAVARHPGDDAMLVSLAFARERLGDTGRALAALEAALQVNPAGGRAAADLVNLLAGTGRTGEALDLAAGFLAAQPGERHVVAALAFALADAGDAAAGTLLDWDRLLHVSAPQATPGFADPGALRTALRSALLSDPSLAASPASKSTRGGLQTGELDLAAHPALAALGRLFTAAAADMARGLRAALPAGHPALAGADPRHSIRAWGTVLAPGGRQLPHIHPHGWVSGVFYVDVPAGMPAEAPGAGWIEFGAPPARFRVAAPPPVHAVEPLPGRLVLFPSYLYHRTLPFAAEGQRISIAFDVVPWRPAIG